ncbi:hypothetical protein MYMA111404_04510 [Mycoplasma marinum]|uniref:Lipoprotein n=1 Tax=Mycoplasma marinum TaxID=1937190 RepID=A0A4R0XJ00_9MOLU|nr:hypothetical protein [Mycoplasma marinum]TCG10573.1 hypothetical protein C4B24_04465 [Mycoplasma marinum]
MKLNRKQISLGALAAVTVIAVPIATVISCGSKDEKSGDLNQIVNNNDGDKTNGDGLVQFRSDKEVDKYVNGINLMESIGNPFSLFDSNAKTTSFNYPQLNLFGARKNNENIKNNKWKVVGKYRIYWDSRSAYKDSKGWKPEELYAVKTKAEFENTLIKVNQNIKSKIDKLPELHKRTLVFANSDFVSGDKDKNDKEYKIIKNDKKYFDLIIYDTLTGDKLSPDMEKSIDSFVKKSNVQANSWNDWTKLDAKMKTPLNADGSKAKPEDLLTRSYIRNQQTGIKNGGMNNESIWISSNLFNGTITEKPNNEKEFNAKEFDEYVKEIKTIKNVHLTTEIYTDLSKNSLRSRVTFSEGGSMDSWKVGSLGVDFDGFENDNTGTVFTINPTTINFNKADEYFIGTKINSIFNNDEKLTQLILDQLEMIIYGTAGENVSGNISIMKGALPGLSNLLTESTPLVEKIENFKVKYGTLNSSSKKALEQIIKKTLPPIKAKMNNQENYGKFLNSLTNFENSTQNILDLNWSPKAKMEVGKTLVMSIIGHSSYDFRTQPFLYFAVKVLADFAPELISNWS